MSGPRRRGAVALVLLVTASACVAGESDPPPEAAPAVTAALTNADAVVETTVAAAPVAAASTTTTIPSTTSTSTTVPTTTSTTSTTTTIPTTTSTTTTTIPTTTTTSTTVPTTTSTTSTTTTIPTTASTTTTSTTVPTTTSTTVPVVTTTTTLPPVTTVPASDAVPEAAPADQSLEPPEWGVFTPEEGCPFLLPWGVTARCGRLAVPLDRTDPDSPLIKLAVAIFPARNGESAPPLAYLDGGPGSKTLASLLFTYSNLIEPLDADRTVVVFDQRGVGYSEPDLSCPEVVERTFELMGGTDEDPGFFLDVLRECSARWAADASVLRHINSAASASDVDFLRRALGYEQWDLFGLSYGTRLALTVMRDYPTGVRRAVLDSVYPLEINGRPQIRANLNRALEHLFAACSADPDCQSRYGDAEALFYGQRALLDEQPAPVALFNVDRLWVQDGFLTGARLLDMVFLGMYNMGVVRSLPGLLDSIRNRDYLDAALVMTGLLFAGRMLSYGQGMAMLCNEEIPFEPTGALPAAALRFPRLQGFFAQAVFQSADALRFCRDLGLGEADPVENLPVRSDIPVLIAAGSFDPITPPEWGRLAARNLSDVRLAEFPDLAHGAALSHECARSVTLGFLDGPQADPDLSCIAARPPVRFD